MLARPSDWDWRNPAAERSYIHILRLVAMVLAAILRGLAETKTDSSCRVIRPKIKSFHRMHAKMISDRGDLQTAMVRSLTALNRKRKGRNYLGLDIKLYLIFHAKNWLKTVHTLVA